MAGDMGGDMRRGIAEVRLMGRPHLAQWRRMLVVTSDFHLPRTRAIFEWCLCSSCERRLFTATRCGQASHL